MRRCTGLTSVTRDRCGLRSLSGRFPWWSSWSVHGRENGSGTCAVINVSAGEGSFRCCTSTRLPERALMWAGEDSVVALDSVRVPGMSATSACSYRDWCLGKTRHDRTPRWTWELSYSTAYRNRLQAVSWLLDALADGEFDRARRPLDSARRATSRPWGRTSSPRLTPS
jgi:hypothetical protein